MNKLLYALLLLPILLVYLTWFFPGLITSGDFWPYFKSMYDLRSVVPYAWDMNSGNGLGGNAVPFLWIHANLGIGVTLFGKLLGLPWEYVERMYYLYPLLALLILCPFLLFRRLFNNNILALVSSLIYTTNTYILMIVSGGQLHGVGMAYAISPLLLFLALNKRSIRNTICIGFALATLLLFDLRQFYTMLFVFSSFVIVQNLKEFRQNAVFKIVLPLLIAVLLHSFWILPLILNPTNPVSDLGEAYSSIESVKFFSFAKLENTISLLHPNWPENIFGKIAFMKPEFFLYTLFAFFPLIMLRHNKTKKYILFFSILGIVGAFLAKGTNDPFGGIYVFLFEYMPGFQMFRDPSKFYLLIAIAYSMLIPLGIKNLLEVLKVKNILFSKIYIILLILSFVLILRVALFGGLRGSFKTTIIPSEYQKLEEFLAKDNNFYRTLWIPEIHRLGYYSNTHPAVSEMRENTRLDAVKLQERSIRYVIVPYDIHGELFVTDRKYDEKKYQRTVENIVRNGKLHEIKGFGRIRVFETAVYQNHFWSEKSSIIQSIVRHNPTSYTVTIINASINDSIIFSENYSPSWIGYISSENGNERKKITASLYKKSFNEFVLGRSGSYKLEIQYRPQKDVVVGIFVSILSLTIVIAIVIYSLLRKTYEKKY